MEGSERILRGLGFSTYEARVIVALMRKHPANGYEVSKLAGIPTSKVYAVLGNLKNGGFIVADEAAKPLQYDPVPLNELLDKLRSGYDRAIGSLEDELKRIAPMPELELSWNLPDYRSVIERIARLLRDARKVAYVSIWPEELKALRPEIQGALERGVRIFVASFGPAEGLGPFAMDIADCGASSERRLKSRLTVAAADSDSVVISEIESEGETVGLWTASPEIVLVAKEYIRHDIWGRAMIDAIGDEAFKRLCAASPLLTALLDIR